MNTYLAVAPVLGSVLTMVLGLVGLSKPAFFMRICGFAPPSSLGTLEIRAIFGGCLLTLGAVCLLTAAPAAYLTAGLLWLASASVKLVFMRIDKVPLRALLAGLAGDLPVGLLMLSGFWICSQNG